MIHSPIRGKTKSPRLISMLDKKRDLWTDSETDLSTASDNDSITVSPISRNVKTSINNTHTSSDRNCCLICSISSSLSNINCCKKHLQLLTTKVPAKVVYMMPSAVNNWSKLECHCRSNGSKSKRHHRSDSSSSSSSSTKPQHRRKKRSVTVLSSNTNRTDETLLSPNIEETTSHEKKLRRTSTTAQRRRLNHLQTAFSSSPPLSSSININMNKKKNSRKLNQTSPSSIITRSKQRNNNQIEPVIQNESMQSNPQSTSTELIELDTELSYSPRILLNRIVHVKDDGEKSSANTSQIILNMAQATRQMVVQKNAQPKILLRRVCLKK